MNQDEIKKLTSTIKCRDRIHCETCRNRMAGLRWRRQVLQGLDITVDINSIDWECPFNVPWEYTKNPKKQNKSINKTKEELEEMRKFASTELPEVISEKTEKLRSDVEAEKQQEVQTEPPRNKKKFVPQMLPPVYSDQLCEEKPEENWCPFHQFRPDGFCEECLSRRKEEDLPELFNELRRRNYNYQKSDCMLRRETGRFIEKRCCGGRVRKIPVMGCKHHETVNPEICVTCMFKELPNT